jgi:hypothetical protein
MIERHNEYWFDFNSVCARPAVKAGIHKFELIAAIDESGKVIDVVTKPERDELNCFKKGFFQIPYPEHKMGVFLSHFIMSNVDTWL